MIAAVLKELHERTSSYSVAVNAAVAAELDEKHPSPLAGGALYRLSGDTLAFHRSVLAMCNKGWAGCSAPLLRTLLDLLVSTLIVVEQRDEAEIRGFRCTHFFLKVGLVGQSEDAEFREHCRRQVEKGIARLKGADQDQARDFIFKAKLSGYWYAPDYFHRPQDVADKLIPDLSEIYALLSSAAHGGFFGLGFFRDAPDLVHPNPRDDPRSEALAVCTSTRILLDQTRARERFELGDKSGGVYNDLRRRLSEAGPILTKGVGGMVQQLT